MVRGSIAEKNTTLEVHEHQGTSAHKSDFLLQHYNTLNAMCILQYTRTRKQCET